MAGRFLYASGFMYASTGPPDHNVASFKYILSDFTPPNTDAPILPFPSTRLSSKYRAGWLYQSLFSDWANKLFTCNIETNSRTTATTFFMFLPDLWYL